MASFLGEIKRRKVFQVAAVYLVVAWLIMQVVDVVNEPLSLPDWFDTVVILLLAIGFPVALILSWAFDLTPDGVVRAEGGSVSPPLSGRKIEYTLIGLLAIAVGALLIREFGPSDLPTATSAALPNSIAVLPFENLSLDPENAFFAAGIHDTILNELARIADMNVIGRTSVLRYADGQTPISQIAEELNVETVMEGTVQYADDQVRITAQLIDPRTGAHLWSDNYDRAFADIFTIQSEIAAQIAEALEAELLPAEQRQIEEPATQSDAAYVFYLRARALIPNIGPFLPPEFYEYLNQALDRDPEFALAHSTLAYGYARALGFDDSGRLGGSVEEHERLATQHAQRALEIDAEQGLAYAALAMIADAYYRLDEAEDNWTRALEVSPNDLEVLDDATIFFSQIDQLQRAYELFERLSELDPAGWGAPFYVALGTKNYDQAATVMREWIRDNPGRGIGIENLTLGLAEAVRGENQAALENLRLSEQLRPDMSAFELALLAYSYGRVSRREEAGRILRRLQAIAENEESSHQAWPQHFALAYLGVGDNAQALRWLNTWLDTPGPQGGSGIGRAWFVLNRYSDPALELSEFVDIRNRLGTQQR